MTRRISAILGKHSGAGQDCTRHFSVPPLEYKNYTSYKKYRPNFGLNIQESYGKRPINLPHPHFSILLQSHQTTLKNTPKFRAQNLLPTPPPPQAFPP